MILITGASGFIGRHLTRRLVHEDDRRKLVTLVGKQDTDYERFGTNCLRELGLNPIIMDLLGDCNALPMTHFDTVVHLAAQTDTSQARFECNDCGTEKLFKSITLTKNASIVFASSLTVADNRPNYSTSINAQIDTLGLPLSEYGRSKLRAEAFLKQYAKDVGCNLRILRLPTVYGPYPRPASMFAIIRHELKNHSIRVRLNWPGVSSYIHVDDVVEVISQLIYEPTRFSKMAIFNLTSQSLPFGEVCQMANRMQRAQCIQLALPQSFWSMISLLLRAWHRTPFARAMPARFGAPLWRLLLVTNHVLWHDGQSLRTFLGHVEPKKLETHLSETLEMNADHIW